MRPELTIRLGTQDPMTLKEVIVDNCYRLPGRFDPADHVIDVGANIGCFAAACLARGCGPITVVEPHPDNFELLVRNLRLWSGQVRAFRGAVYERSRDWVPLCDCGPMSAMHYVGSGADGIAITAPRLVLDQLIIDATTQRNQMVRLLKLDCEGAEYVGLAEANRLPLCREIVVECHPVDLDGKNRADADVRARLEAVGFEITAVEPDKHARNVVVWARNKKL